MIVILNRACQNDGSTSIMIAKQALFLFVFLIALCAVYLPVVAQFRSSIYGIQSNDYSGLPAYIRGLSTNEAGNVWMISTGNTGRYSFTPTLSKLRPDGSIIWQRTTSSAFAFSQDMAQDPNNQDFVITEAIDSTTLIGPGTYNDTTKFSSLKVSLIDSGGNQVWVKALKVDGFLKRNEAASYEGNIFCSGFIEPTYTLPTSAVTADSIASLRTNFVVRIRRNGGIAYQIRLESPKVRLMYKQPIFFMAPMPNGGLAILHYTYDYNLAASQNELAIFVSLLDSNGIEFATKSFNTGRATSATPRGIVYRDGRLYVLTSLFNSQIRNSYGLGLMRLKADSSLLVEQNKELRTGGNIIGDYLVNPTKRSLTFAANGSLLLGLGTTSNSGLFDLSSRVHYTLTRLDSNLQIIHTKEYGGCPARSSTLIPILAQMPNNNFIMSAGLGCGFTSGSISNDRLIENALLSPPDNRDELCRLTKSYPSRMIDDGILRPFALGPTEKAQTLPLGIGTR